MSIFFFTKGNRSTGSSRQRVWNVADRLQQQYNIHYEVVHSIGYSLFSVKPARIKLFVSLVYRLQAVRHKLLFVHKSLFPWDVVLLIVFAKKFLGKKLVYDLDDAEWIHSRRKSEFLARHADAVFCGSHAILEWAKQHNENCVFVPTVVDAAAYAKHAVTHQERTVFTIGWIGYGRAHFKQGNFELIQHVFAILSRKGVSFRFVLAVSENYQPLKEYFAGVPYETVFIDQLDWDNPEVVPYTIQTNQFDVGLMPLTDTLFNRAKCAFKAIEYMACGVPVVASPVGEAQYVIQEGKTGYMARSPEEWAEKISFLFSNASLRKQMSKKGQEKVHKEYSYQTIIPEIYAILVKLLK